MKALLDRSALLRICALPAVAALALAAAQPAAAQAVRTGAVEFEARVTPAEGQPEPVRQISFYLLRKSLADIQNEVAQGEPAPDLDAFIDKLEASPELKSWMKKNRLVEFVGTDFTKRVSTDDILAVPEFLEAYKNLNGAVLNTSLPAFRASDNDRLKNPQKYQREIAKYQKALLQYIKGHPQSIDGLDAELADRTFGRRWAQLQADCKRRAEQRAMILAQTEYLAAKAESDLSGRGIFRGLAPGTYWITTLNVPALAGSARVQWDLRVTVRSGETSRVELSNLNAISTIERASR